MPTKRARALKTAVILHGIGLLATVLFCLLTHLTRNWGVFRLGFCATRAVLHIYCPGCGATRAVFACLRGHFGAAFLYYPALFIALALILYADVLLLLSLLRHTDRPLFYIRGKLYLVIPAVAVLWAAVRTVLAYTIGFDPLGDLTP